ncbi:MAG: hypothetical protein M1830_008818 [Pleopsidium flavum]|nr:MAG: hypothetical protein M1830_008818 [Pleopsidium flavum]
MHFINVAAVALVSFVCTTAVHGVGLNRVALEVTPGDRAVADGNLKARRDYEAWHNHEFSISARQAPAQDTVTVTVTTIPDYCSTVSSVVVSSSSAAASAVIPLPTASSAPAPKNITVPGTTGGAVPKGYNSTLTSSATFTLPSATSTASAGATSSTPATASSNDTPAGRFNVLPLAVTLVVMILHSIFLI